MKKLFWLLMLLAAALPAMAYRDLETGTFISRDPAGFIDGPNMYGYVSQNPWTKFDPDGLSEEMANGILIRTDSNGYNHIIRGGDPMQGRQLTNRLEVAVAEVAINGASNRSFRKLDRVPSNLRGPLLPFATLAVADPEAADQILQVIAGIVDVGPRGPLVSRGPRAQKPTSPAESAKDTKAQATAEAEVNGPTEPYNRKQHYGKTPTTADRKAVGVGEGEVADHDPPLVKRYYEGDPAVGEKPGFQQTPQERAASAGDRSRMRPQPKPESDAQGGKMSQYSKEKKKEFFEDKQKN